MKIRTIFTLILSYFTLVLSQEEIPPEDYMVELDFNIREEKIPAIIYYLFNNSLVERDITSKDMIQLSKLNRYSLEDIKQVLKYYNTSVSEKFTVDTLECLLDSIDMEFNDFYQGVTQKLGLSDTTIQQVLNDLEINQLNFLMAVISKSYIYDILRKGSYDQEHVNTALATMSKSGSDVYNAARDAILDHIYEMNSTEFMQILKENGINRNSFNQLWTALNITTRDVYDVVKFRDIFSAISDKLNQNLTIAVFVGRNELAIHEQIYRRFENIVDGVTIKIEAGDVEVDAKATRRLGTNIVEMVGNPARDKYIEITDNYNTTENCSYSTFVEQGVSTQRVEVEDFLKVKKSEGVVFKLGSPLVCEGRLYGLAREEKNGLIIFDRFYTEQNPKPLEEEETSGSSKIFFQGMWGLLISSLMCFILF